MRRRRGLTAAAVLLLSSLAALPSCVPGGEASGFPDTTVGDWRFPMGTLSTGGRVDLFREQDWTQPPGARIGAR
jgi:hypothetical protein